MFRSIYLFLFILFINIPYGYGASPPPLYVFAAASTKSALEEVIHSYYQQYGTRKGKIIPSFASSGTLASQISKGAPASLYLSADPLWTEYLHQKHLLAYPSTKLFANRLMLAYSSGHRGQNGKLAYPLGIGNPRHVPVGRYGLMALKNMNIPIHGSLIYAPSSSILLHWLLQGELEAAILYHSDVKTRKLKAIYLTGPPISYSLALLDSSHPQAKQFYDFLQSKTALEVFYKHGFEKITSNAY
ncbi:MAG: molybdate ABC transporter substrate-binding protein [Parvibaculales bacterium]